MTSQTPEPIDLDLRQRLLDYDEMISTGRQVNVTAPDVAVEDETGAPSGVGVVDQAMPVGAAVLDAALLTRAGLTAEQVPNLTFRDIPSDD